MEPRNHSRHDRSNGYGIRTCLDGFSLLDLASGRETPVQLPGMLYHAYNSSRKPVCFMVDMTMTETRDGRLIDWGANRTHYLKPGEWYFKIIGVTHSMANRESADLGWSGGIRVWDPVRAGGCSTP